MEKPTNIHDAISQAKVAVGVIGKDDTNTQQQYSFRVIDAIVNRVGPVFADLGIVVSPVHRLLSSEDVVAKTGAKGYRVVVETVWTFSIADDDLITAQTLGESIDYSDKAINQAQTQSFKNALAQVLTIPTGEPDPDSTSPEQVKPPTAGEKILVALTKEGFETEAARKYTKEAMALLEITKKSVLNDRVSEVIATAIDLHNAAEKPFKVPSGHDPADQEGSYGD